MKNFIVPILLGIISLSSFSCKANPNSPEKIKVGAESMEKYLPKLQGRRVGLVVNHTSTVGHTHLLDTLLAQGVDVMKVFAPEHGFRGEADAGAHIGNETDSKTGLPIVSLYGKSRKPSASHLAGIDILVFDIQDVGVRFYTYISTLHNIIEASAENGIPLLVLDRPNPNGHYVGGPVLEEGFESFVGMNKIPVVYGLTIGELAQMINEEKWASQKHCDLEVIPCENYTHESQYDLPIKPSPNLPNAQSVWLYPSICLFEPTKISVGRGTDHAFQVIGGPDPHLGKYTFRPEDKPGAHDPVNKGLLCYGEDLSDLDARNMGFDLKYLFSFYENFKDKANFFTNERFFNLLAGNAWLIKDLKSGMSLTEAEAKWQPALEKFKILRKQYLIYPDFK